MKIVGQSVEFIDELERESILRKIEQIGRVCYKSEDKITDDSAAKFVKMLVDRGHQAMIEHVNITVKFTTNRGVSHEVVRHRLASYAQESTRYVNYNKEKNGSGITVIDQMSGFKYDLADPTDLLKYNIWREAMQNAETSYLALIKVGATPEEARSVLPNSTKTEIVMTANLREWIHFLSLRTSKYAHPDIRVIAIQTYDYFVKELPEIFLHLDENVFR